MTLDPNTIPNGWRLVKLGEVADITMGQSPPSETYNKEGYGLPFLQGKADFSNLYPNPTNYCTRPLKVAKQGSVLISVRAPVGDSNLSDRDYIIGRGLSSVSLKEGNNLFLFYLLVDNKERLAALGSGTTFQSINRTVLDTFKVKLPPLAEQQTIAESLRAAQEAREARQRELTVERERKAALMHQLFTRGTRGEPTIQTEIGEIPNSWQLVTIGEIASITSGGTPDRSNVDYWNGNIPWVKTGEINYNIITDTEEKISLLGLKYSAAKIIPSGTLLIAMYGQGVTRGRVAILGIEATLNQACAAILIEDKIYTPFLFHFLSFSYERIRNLGHGANQKNLNSALIKSIKIPLPSSYIEQQEIAEVLQACDEKIKALEVECDRLEELFKALLEELMTGRLSVKALVEEQEEVLA